MNGVTVDGLLAIDDHINRVDRFKNPLDGFSQNQTRRQGVNTDKGPIGYKELSAIKWGYAPGYGQPSPPHGQLSHGSSPLCNLPIAR